MVAILIAVAVVILIVVILVGLKIWKKCMIGGRGTIHYKYFVGYKFCGFVKI